MNIAILTGNIGKDPESRVSQSGTAVCKFSLATTETYKGEKQTTWHNIVCFSKTAELVEKYLTKGSKIGIEGKIQNRSYEKDGQKKYISEVVANRVEFLDSKGNQSQNQQPQPQSQYYSDHGGNPPAADNQLDDDIPF